MTPSDERGGQLDECQYVYVLTYLGKGCIEAVGPKPLHSVSSLVMSRVHKKSESFARPRPVVQHGLVTDHRSAGGSQGMQSVISGVFWQIRDVDVGQMLIFAAFVCRRASFSFVASLHAMLLCS